MGVVMPEPIYPGAVWNPGVNADYRAGRTPVRSVVCHYTVGRDSTAIGLRGYFQWLVGRDGTVQQFAEADAVCWHGGSPWNGYGPGIEVEYLPGHDDELWTPVQRDAVARLCQWLHDEWSVPFDFYDGPRTNSHNGFITHRSLIQTGDAHSDWWPELPRVAPEPDPPKKDDTMRLFRTEGTDTWTLWDGINWTENVDHSLVWALAVAGVPSGVISAPALHQLHVIVGEHVEALVQRVAAAVNP